MLMGVNGDALCRECSGLLQKPETLKKISFLLLQVLVARKISGWLCAMGICRCEEFRNWRDAKLKSTLSKFREANS